MIYLYELIQGLLIGWMITHFEPIQTYIGGSLEGINIGLFSNKKFIYGIFGRMIKVLTCQKCSTFWSTLIISNNLYIAIIGAIIAYHYDKWNGNMKIKL